MVAFANLPYALRRVLLSLYLGMPLPLWITVDRMGSDQDLPRRARARTLRARALHTHALRAALRSTAHFCAHAQRVCWLTFVYSVL